MKKWKLKQFSKFIYKKLAVATIADCTALQHLSGSRGVIGHVTIWYTPIGHFLLVVLWNQASISNGFPEARNARQHVETLLLQPRRSDTVLAASPWQDRPPGILFRYAAAILHVKTKVNIINFGTNRLPVNSIFCSRIHRLATIHSVQTDRQTDRQTQCNTVATVITVG